MNVLSVLSRSFSPLRNSNFRIYIGGQAVSLIGTWLQATAQAWLVWKLTGSEASLGVVTMLNTLPLLLLSPWAGVWADRFDRRKLLVGTQVVAMLLAFVLAGLVATNLIQLWHVFILSFLLGVVNTLDMPAQQAFLGDLAGMGEVRKAVNVNAMILQLSRSIGPAFAGFLIARIGMAPSFALNGLSFLAVIFSLLAVRANQMRSTASQAKPLMQIMDAARFIRSEPRLQDLFFFTTLMTFFFWSIVLNLLPSIASKTLNGDAQTLGLLQGASGLGALVGVLLIVPLAQAARRTGLVMGSAAVWVGLSVLLFSQAHTPLLGCMALFLASIAVPVIFTMALGLIQVMAKVGMRARLLSLFTMITFGMQPVAAILIGAVAERIGTQTVLEINGTMILLATIALLMVRTEFRQWEVTTALPPVETVMIE